MNDKRYLIGTAERFGDIDVGEGDLRVGVFVACERDAIRDMKRLPYAQAVALVPVADLADMDNEIGELKRELDASCNADELRQARAALARVEAELESHEWEISPAMVQAKMDGMQAEIDRLNTELAALRRDATFSPAEALIGVTFVGENTLTGSVSELEIPQNLQPERIFIDRIDGELREVGKSNPPEIVPGPLSGINLVVGPLAGMDNITGSCASLAGIELHRIILPPAGEDSAQQGGAQ